MVAFNVMAAYRRAEWDRYLIAKTCAVFGVTERELCIRRRRTGHRHRGTRAWANRKGIKS